ncbi:MAG: NAD-dependent dihydropyrimidine dehydrogenase subunit PreA [Anaerolineales bacterium]|nr:NAD-dependent dihydropyrimidine dehydrogenase subunit PreA [Anaerolineales bacterium]
MSIYKQPQVDLSVEYCGLKFVNPFVLASAPPTDTYEMVRDAFRAGWAGAVLKTTSMEDYVVDIAYPCIAGVKQQGNLIGLGNIDNISEFHMDKMEAACRMLKEEFPDRIVATSIWGTTKESWEELTRRSIEAGADYLEVSMSCPTDSPIGGMHFMIGQVPDEAYKVVSWIVNAADGLPIVPKLTGDVTDIVSIAKAVKEAGAAALCATDSRHGMIGVDLESLVPIPNIEGKGTFGGMVGAFLKPFELRTLATLGTGQDLKVAASGGATTWHDAAEYISLGATLVQVCTAAMLYGFGIVEDLKEGLAYYLESKNMASVQELLGKALPNVVPQSALNPIKHAVAFVDKTRCTKCGRCVVSCQDGGHQAYIIAEDGYPEVDKEKCYGCGLCPEVCPAECISLEPR